MIALVFFAFCTLSNGFDHQSEPDRSLWKKEIEDSLKRNLNGCSYHFNDGLNHSDEVSSASITVKRMFPKHAELKHLQQLPESLTMSHEGMKVNAISRGYSYEKWGKEKDLRWEVPDNHPGQDKKNCLNMTFTAAEGKPLSFYNSFRQPNRAFYTSTFNHAYIHPVGSVATSCGYFMGQECCEGRFNQAENWYNECKRHLQKLKLRWEALWDDTLPIKVIKGLQRHCIDRSDIAIPFGAKNASTYLPRRVNEKVFVITALWDYNYHHFFADSLARLAHALPYLRAHPEVFIHIRAYEIYDGGRHEYEHELRAAEQMRRHLLELLGFEMKRIISGAVFAKQAIIPRCMRCSYAASNPVEVRLLARELLLASEAEVDRRKQLNLTISPFISSTSATKGKNMIVLQRYTPYGDNDRDWSDETFQRILASLATHFPHHNIIPISSKKQSKPDYCLACEFVLYPQIDVLVGAHGAGLTNVLFLKPGGLLVEIAGEFKDVNMPVCGYYGPLASLVGCHHYIFVHPTPTDEKKDVLDSEDMAQRAASFYHYLHDLNRNEKDIIKILKPTGSKYKCIP